MMKTAVLSLALLAGVNAQATTTATGYVSQPLPTTTSTTPVYSGLTGYPTTTGYPYTTGAVQYIPQTTQQVQYIPQTTQQVQYYPQPTQQYYPTTAAPAIAGPPAGQQYPQYKVWAGKACVLIDLTTSPTGAVKTKGVIREDDLTGNLSCDINAPAAQIAAAAKAAVAAGATEAAGATTGSSTTGSGTTAFVATAAKCKLIATATATNGAACIAAKFPTKAQITQAATPTFKPTAALCKTARATVTAAKTPYTVAVALAVAKSAACTAAGL